MSAKKDRAISSPHPEPKQVLTLSLPEEGHSRCYLIRHPEDTSEGSGWMRISYSNVQEG